MRMRFLQGLPLLAMVLAGCSDKPAPSEAAVEPDVTTYNHQEVISNALRSGRIPLLVFDDCDPSDPAWNEVGGCTQVGGLVDFNAFLAALPQGHPAWQFLPSYLRLDVERLRINAVNRGGREHTFTRVAEFGGGVVPILNAPGQEAAPECADPEAFGSSFLPPGGRLSVEVQHGTHRYQCCIHPWMRTELRLN